MIRGSPLASAARSSAVEEMKAICFPSGDHATSLPVSGRGELVPASGASEVALLPSGCAIKRLLASPSLPWNAIHLLSADHRGLPAGLSPPRRTLLSVLKSMTQSWPDGLPG